MYRFSVFKATLAHFGQDYVTEAVKQQPENKGANVSLHYKCGEHL